ncbi:MAG: hypothetical protein E7380_02820 [Clostridiales bacterium]|nr:hypothetical protein [Clostridiales bacterium]
MRKFLGLVLTGMLLFCTVFSIVSCGEEKDTGKSSMLYEVPAKEIAFTQGDIGGTLKKNEINLYKDTRKIIRTRVELVSVFSGIEITWGNQPIWQRYDENFFKTKSLIFVLQRESGTDIERVVEYVGLENNEVTVYITEYNDGFANDAMVVFYSLLEVNKADIVNVGIIKTEYVYKMK